MSSKNNNGLYVGAANNLIRKVYEHINEIFESFTKRDKCKKIIWYKGTHDIKSAIQL